MYFNYFFKLQNWKIFSTRIPSLLVKEDREENSEGSLPFLFNELGALIHSVTFSVRSEKAGEKNYNLFFKTHSPRKIWKDHSLSIILFLDRLKFIKITPLLISFPPRLLGDIIQ